MKLELSSTSRGFGRIDFKDRYDLACSLQESSLATEAAIWLGANEGTHVDGQCAARMHLTVEMVAALLPYLQEFIETGQLGEPPHRHVWVLNYSPVEDITEEECACGAERQILCNYEETGRTQITILEPPPQE